MFDLNIISLGHHLNELHNMRHTKPENKKLQEVFMGLGDCFWKGIVEQS